MRYRSGNVTFNPDVQIRETIVDFFDTFSRVGSACQTVKAVRKERLLFPSRLRNSETTVFRTLIASTAIRIHGMRRHTPMDAGLSTNHRRQEDSGVTRMTGWRAYRMPLPATSPGSNSRRISRFSRPTVRYGRAHRLLGRYGTARTGGARAMR